MKLKSFADAQSANTIELDDGRRILLEELIQSRTYAGLLMGIPRDDMNESIIEAALDRAKRILGEHPEPHLLKPKMLEFELNLAPMRIGRELKAMPDDGEIRRVQGKRLPLTLCLASFSCPEPIDQTRDGRIFDASIASLVWFQEAFGPPLAPDVLQQIKGVPWGRVACDVSQ